MLKLRHFIIICIILVKFSSSFSSDGLVVRKNYTGFKRRDKRESSLGSAFFLVQGQLIDGLERLQTAMGKKMLDCMPRSVFYNGSCIYISSKHEKLSWKHAERFCRKLPLNTSFLVIQNDHKMDFIRREVVKLRELEAPNDQLSFNIGFNFTKTEWKWVSNVSLAQSNLTLGRYWWDWSGSHGDCGSLALLKSNELIMRSAPCFNTRARFMCEYSLNPCYMNDICGTHGRCINLYYKFYCDCSTSMFFEGKYCEKINFKGIQSIVGLFVVSFLLAIIVCNSRKFNSIWIQHFGKDVRTNKKTTKMENQSEKNDKSDAGVDVEKQAIGGGDVLFANENSKSYMNSLSKKFERKWQSFKNYFAHQNISYVMLFILTIILAFVQIVFAHDIISFSIMEEARNSTNVKYLCRLNAQYYMFEDLLYMPFSLLFLIILYFQLQSRRFNRYIMFKWRPYFKSQYFKDIQHKNLELIEKKRKDQDKRIKQQKCGNCRLYSRKLCSSNSCLPRTFCCICCCSCFVPTSSSTRCFLWYCCMSGWRQTDPYKIYKAIKSTVGNIFYYGLFCCVWKPLWLKTKQLRDKRKQAEEEDRKEQRKKDKEAKKAEQREKRLAEGEEEDLDEDEDFDETDYDLRTQSFSRGQCPFPSTPFSTSNRSQSACVYVIYTYDVLNIFMSLFTTTFTPIYVPYFGDVNLAGSGVIVNIIIQFLQVLIIGIKFYPILVVADAEPHLIIYLFATLYILVIWILRFFKRSFCSRTEAFITQTVKQIGKDIGGQIKSTLNLRYNISNTVLGLFSDDPNPNEKYMSALKNSIPSVFKEFFGRYNPSNTVEDSEDFLIPDDSYTTSSGYYLYSTMSTTTTLPATTTSYGMRDRLKNKTITKIKSFKGFYFQRDEYFALLVSILENLPIYLTLSYLLIRYGMLFFGCIATKISDLYNAPKKESSPSQNDTSLTIAKAEFNDTSSLSEANSEVTTSQLSNEASSVTSQPHRHSKKLRSAGRFIKNMVISSRRNSTMSQKGPENDPSRNDEDLNDLLKMINKGYQEENIFKLTNSLESKDNHNYLYIKRLFADFCFYDVTDTQKNKREESKRQGFKTKLHNSFLYSLFVNYIYMPIPYMKYSKQLINTYTVAFMVIYFFTLFGFKLSNIFGNALVGTIELVYKFVFRGLIPSIDTDSHNFNTEFRLASLVTSLISIYHMFKGIKKFREDLVKLHKGEKQFSSLVIKYRNQDYSKVLEKRAEASRTIALDSLHFPGYLVAHLVYGYVLMFLGIFSIIIVVKVFLYMDGMWERGLELFLPIFILFAFKWVFIKFAVTAVLMRDKNNQRITNLAFYYVLSYFNFFFDCFLGLVACMSRIWQTAIISMLYLPRLDTSMFNAENEVLIRRIDKGHLAYLNYVRMEHWYNNQILKGFCELLLESMFYSQIYKNQYKSQARSQAYSIQSEVNGSGKIVIKKLISKTATSKTYSTTELIIPKVMSKAKQFNPMHQLKALPVTVPENQEEDEDDNGQFSTMHQLKALPMTVPEKQEEDEDDNGHKIDIADLVLRDQEEQRRNPSTLTREISRKEGRKIGNDSFQYKSFLRLRNMIFLCLLLRKNPSLQRYRLHYLEVVRKEEREKLKEKSNQTAGEFLEEHFVKKFKTLKKKIAIYKGSTSPSSSSSKMGSTSSSIRSRNGNGNDNQDEALSINTKTLRKQRSKSS